MDQTMGGIDERHAEMSSGVNDTFDAGPEDFLMHFAEAKKAVNIPVIASLNAVYDDTWAEYAKKLEDAGADALELNFYNNPKDFEMTGRSILNSELDIIETVKKVVSIPVSVKLSPFYTNPLYTFNEMDKKGVDGFVLFNRLFHPDINVNLEKMSFPYNLSSEYDSRLPLRYVGLLYDNINGSIISSGGIYQGNDVVKMILAGADAVQIVSAVYKHKPQHIAKMLKDIDDWMEAHNYSSLNDFRGKLSQKNVQDNRIYKRAQYVNLLMRAESVFNKYPMP